MESHSQIVTSTPQLCPVVTTKFGIYLVQNVPAEFKINGITVAVQPDDGIFINSDQIVQEYTDTLCLQLASMYLRERGHWQAQLVDRVQEKKIQPYFVLHQSIPAEKAVLDGLQILASINQQDTESYPFLSPGIIYSMFQALTERVAETCTLDFPPDDQVRCRDLMKYFAAHYSERLNLPDVAKVFDVTPNTCIKTFRKYIGITPIDYLNLYRMNVACGLLKTTKEKIADIAADVGVPDKSYFTASFKKILGMTPSQYRKQNTPQAG